MYANLFNIDYSIESKEEKTETFMAAEMSFTFLDY